PGMSRWAWLINLPVLLAALLLVLGVRNLLRALAEYPSRRPVEGEVVRLVARSVGDSEHRSYLYYAGIDDGRSPKIRAYRLSGDQYRRLDEGDEGRVVAGRWLGRGVEGGGTREQAPPPDTEAVPSVPTGNRDTTADTAQGGAGAVAARLGAAAPEPAVDLDPAGLVRPEDVAAVLGTPVVVRPVGPQGGVPFLQMRMCTYAAPGAEHPTLLVQVASGGLAGRMLAAGRTRGEPVPGVPDAYFFQGGHRQEGVVVLRGSTSLAIGSYGANLDRMVLARLAAAAATRLAALPTGRGPGPPPAPPPPPRPGPPPPPPAGAPRSATRRGSQA